MSQCLKCGKKAEDRSVFCVDCLATMDQYPIKPGTVVHLPRRQPIREPKNTDFEETPQSVQLASQRSMIRWLTGIVAALSVLLVITAVLLLHSLEKAQLPVIGRNYTTSTSAQKP